MCIVRDLVVTADGGLFNRGKYLATFHGGEQSNAVAQPCFPGCAFIAANGFTWGFIRFGGVLCHVCIIREIVVTAGR